MPLASSGATDQAVGVYLNRLSDYLFTLARAVVRHASASSDVSCGPAACRSSTLQRPCLPVILHAARRAAWTTLFEVIVFAYHIQASQLQ